MNKEQNGFKFGPIYRLSKLGPKPPKLFIRCCDDTHMNSFFCGNRILDTHLMLLMHFFVSVTSEELSILNSLFISKTI